MKRTTLISTLTGAVLAAALSTSPAMAAKDVGYGVQAVATGTLEYEEFERADDWWHKEEVDLVFDWAGEIGEAAVFRDGHLFATRGSTVPDGTISGTVTISGQSGAQTCTGFESAATRGQMRFAGQYAANEEIVPLDGEEHVFLRPFDSFGGGWGCGGDWNFSWSLASGDTAIGAEPGGEDEVKPGENPFDILFSLPPEAIGPGYVEQLIPERTLTGDDCPSSGSENVVECKMTWSGRVKLRKLWEREVAPGAPPSTGPGPAAPPAGHGAPAPPAAPTPPVPSAPQPPAELDDDFLVPLVPAERASLTRGADRARFDVSCAAACTGTATLTAAAPGRAASRRGPRPLARTRFAVEAGKSRTIRLRLDARARRAVRRARGARLTVRTTAAGRTTTRTLRLRVPARTTKG